MAVTSQIARIKVGPNSRNKTTIYTATKVTGPTGNPPQYSTEIIRYSDAKGNNATVIGTSNNAGKISFNDNASADEKKYQGSISRASTNQVNSVSGDIATTSQEKAALNKISGSNNQAVDSGTKDLRGQGNRPLKGNPNRQNGQVGVVDEDVSDDTSSGGGTSSKSKTADGTRNKFGILVYPTTLRKERSDTICFTMMKYIPKGLANTNNQFGGDNRSTSESRSIGKVFLPIPGGIGDNNGVDWNSGSMNAGQMALAQIALKTIEEGFKEGANEAQNALKNIGSNSGEVKDALSASIAGAATGDSKALMQRADGQVINPNMELLFGGPKLREFSFSFNLTARSADEGRTILKIIRFFKQGMSPIKSASNLFLKSPHTFRLEYKNANRTHQALNRFKECALTSCGIQYTPDGNYSTFGDGIMTKYQMALGFSELEPVFNSDYSENGIGQNEIGY